MNITTKTGLIASPRKRIFRATKSIDPVLLLPYAIAKPAAFSLRPFGGLYNPYSKGCSVLCNHPASSDIKSVVKKAKDSWMSDGRAISLRSASSSRRDHRHDDIFESDLADHAVPEEFFRRYTDTDSRPLTPAPTMASAKTRGGANVNARRCVTPEPQGSQSERKQLILDLRRSHSQDVFAVSDLSPTQLQDAFNVWAQEGEAQRIQTVEEHPDEGEDNAPYERFSHTPSSAHIRTVPQLESDEEDDDQKQEITCINALDDEPDDEDAPRRRGKKRKKSKQAIATTFTASQEPETHITTLGPDDTPLHSHRPSFSFSHGGSIQPPTCPPRAAYEIVETDNSDFFLDEEALKLLRRGLNIDIVEEVFDRYKHRAMKEALRLTAPGKLDYESEAVRELKEALKIPEMDHDKWIELPRRYSRSSARFGLPMDTRELMKMTPVQYLGRHVSVLSDRKQLYHRIFVRNLPLPTGKEKDNSDSEDEDELREQEAKGKLELVRTLPYSVLDKALHEVLGFHGKPDKISKIRDLIGLTPDNNGNEVPIDFRTWCGVVAFAERYLTDTDKDDDPCNEIEIADFESLDRRIKNVKGNEKLINILYIIKNN